MVPRLTEIDRTNLRNAQDRVERTVRVIGMFQRDLVRYSAERDALLAYLRGRYQLGAADVLDPETGEIRRAT